MEKHPLRMVLLCFLILCLGLIASSACIASELKRPKDKDVKFDGKLCHLPQNPAFILGVCACVCLLTAQIIGNTVIAMPFCSRGNKIFDWKQRVPRCLLLLSWISFGTAATLLSVATSMNQMQPYGKGWLDGECYIVRDGVYIVAAALIFTTVMFILGSIMATRTRISK
ncbi:hypothetical protein IFM89_039460 [Coptis chinensis]|uniref:Uncharacterized protein n=1 Tax=Coptis chinensis TaxID=261450 RepID=A0A835MGY6_9MAGN|nr:hypothetical protein IFM89_039460 [Coptis chinensis]